MRKYAIYAIYLGIYQISNEEGYNYFVKLYTNFLKDVNILFQKLNILEVLFSYCYWFPNVLGSCKCEFNEMLICHCHRSCHFQCKISRYAYCEMYVVDNAQVSLSIV